MSICTTRSKTLSIISAPYRVTSPSVVDTGDRETVGGGVVDGRMPDSIGV